MDLKKIKAAIIGPGNIGTDLLYKLGKSKYLELDTVVGKFKNSKGLKIAAAAGYNVTCEGIESILENEDIKIVFDATSAKAHLKHADLLKKENKIAIDLTPAAVGPYVVPSVNLNVNMNTKNINLVTCGGQATIPIVWAINKASNVKYAEIVATIASKSAGPGTRHNIDEFTETTACALEKVGGADKGKAIIILNPAEPPLIMKNTVYAKVENLNEKEIDEAVNNIVNVVKGYVPGYRLKVPPIYDGNKITVMIEVEGAGEYLPKYSGNLDIITSAAAVIGDKIALKILQRGDK